MNKLSEILVFDPMVLAVCGGMLAVLAVGSALRLATAKARGRPVGQTQRASLGTWWCLAGALVVATLLGRFGVAGLFFAASSLAFREYVPLVLGANRPRTLQWCGYLLIAAHYGLIVGGREHAALVFLPLGGFLASNLLSMWGESTRDFLRAAALLQWGLMLVAYLPSHAVMLLTLEFDSGASPAALFLYLVIMTELNDIAQALVGRSWGRRGIAPVVSPKKTWEGFLGGVLTTTVVATALAPWMTPFAPPPSLWTASRWASALLWPGLLGVVIGVSGLLGDLTVSALKRNVGVKDSSDLLPGQGGMLDRIDSLTLTAPAVFYFAILLPESSVTP